MFPRNVNTIIFAFRKKNIHKNYVQILLTIIPGTLMGNLKIFIDWHLNFLIKNTQKESEPIYSNNSSEESIACFLFSLYRIHYRNLKENQAKKKLDSSYEKIHLLKVSPRLF